MKTLNLILHPDSRFPVNAPSLGSIEAYISWVNQIPRLDAEEELYLANEFCENNNLDAVKKLIISHLRFVTHIAAGYLGYGLPRADLIQEGNIGLMKAIRRFNPKIGVRLASFAVHWIKAEIHEFVLRNWKIVKIATTKAQRKLFFNLRKSTKRFVWLTNDETQNIAKELAVTPEEVKTMEARMQNQDVSFDGHQDSSIDNYDDNYKFPVDYLASEDCDPQEQFLDLDVNNRRLIGLKTGLSKLDSRSRDIVESRWLNNDKSTLQELAIRYNLSAERIRQIEESAITKLKLDVIRHIGGN